MLGRKHPDVFADREELRFVVQMLPGSHFVATCDNTQGVVLDGLKTVQRRRFNIWVPHCSRVVDFGTDNCLVGEE